MPDYDYQYLKMLADNQAGVLGAEKQGEIANSLEGAAHPSAPNQAHAWTVTPPMIAREGEHNYYSQAAPVNAEHYNPLKDNPAWKSDASLTASPGHHGADLQVPYRYEPDVNQRIDDAERHGASSMVTGFQNLLKLLSHHK